ncbi:MAG TPA: hypothetical protein VJU81_12425 [Methylomirabilota bacterium]|nr:hypothetical protein [Methylomirabilota bacterium]
MTTTDVPATLAVFGAPPAPATARVARQTPADRMRRVLTALGIFWGLAIPAVFMPVAHFILVPSLLLIGAVVAALRSREDMRLLGAHGRCPRCGVDQEFPGGGRFHGEQALDCPRCHNRLTLTARVA